MDLSVFRDTHLCLTFHEAIIFWENRGLNRPAMFNRLRQLQRYTRDPALRAAATSLLWKLTQVNEKAYAHLASAAASGDLLFPPNHKLT